MTDEMCFDDQNEHKVMHDMSSGPEYRNVRAAGHRLDSFGDAFSEDSFDLGGLVETPGPYIFFHGHTPTPAELDAINQAFQDQRRWLVPFFTRGMNCPCSLEPVQPELEEPPARHRRLGSCAFMALLLWLFLLYASVHFIHVLNAPK